MLGLICSGLGWWGQGLVMRGVTPPTSVKLEGRKRGLCLLSQPVSVWRLPLPSLLQSLMCRDSTFWPRDGAEWPRDLGRNSGLGWSLQERRPWGKRSLGVWSQGQGLCLLKVSRLQGPASSPLSPFVHGHASVSAPAIAAPSAAAASA